MNVKNKLNIGRKGADFMTIGGVIVFTVVLAIMLWYYTQPTPPELFVTKVISSLDEKGTECSAIVSGEVFNNGGTKATGVSVTCSAGYGTKRATFVQVPDVESKKSSSFEAVVPLKSCSETVGGECKIASCTNCKK